MKPVIVIHGGAGAVTRSQLTAEMEAQYLDALRDIVRGGQSILEKGGSALDAVTKSVSMLEDCPLFNAGRGAVYTHDKTHELDASIMDGGKQASGAICGVKHIKNPIFAARKVMEKSKHVMFTGEGAEKFAKAHGIEMVDSSYFDTEKRMQQLEKALAEDKIALDHDVATQEAEPIDPEHKYGTVGAVAIDVNGNLAAATSTGGMTNKQVGRIGDSPIIGAGCYADNESVAVSCTGTGEYFIRLVAAHEIASLVKYKGLTIEEAAQDVVMMRIPALGGSGGMIIVDKDGNICLPFCSEGMYRGYGYVNEAPVAKIYRD